MTLIISELPIHLHVFTIELRCFTYRVDGWKVEFLS
jgi:hypothetical protein